MRDALAERGYAFEFHQAVRILEWLSERTDGRAPVGRTSEPDREAVRFRSLVSLAFPASEVTGVSTPEDGEAPTVTVSFLGLASGLGPLPRPFTEHLIERIGKKDTALRDFLDVFNHRLVSYFYRARVKHRITLRHCSPEESGLADQLFALMGLGEPSLRGRLRGHAPAHPRGGPEAAPVAGGIPDRALLMYAGVLARPVRSCAGLEGILRDYLDVTVEVHPFRGRWRALEPDQWTRLGPGGANQRLGEDAVLGTRAWDQAGTFEVRLGPMGLEDFLRFLPGAPRAAVADGDKLSPLRELTRLYAGVELEAQWRLVLTGTQVPGTVLSSGAGASRLGYTSWLTQGGRSRDGEVVLMDTRWSATS